MQQTEFDALINDESKTINGDLYWINDEDHSPALEFKVNVESESGYPLVVKGSFNPLAQTLTYAFIHKIFGRIYALDIGKDHKNPTGEHVGETHKHRWSEKYRDKHAYIPPDITAFVTDPIAVWGQFCAEAKLMHKGIMHPPPPTQMELL